MPYLQSSAFYEVANIKFAFYVISHEFFWIHGIFLLQKYTSALNSFIVKICALRVFNFNVPKKIKSCIFNVAVIFVKKMAKK